MLLVTGPDIGGSLSTRARHSWLDQGGEERDRGCSVTEFYSSERSSHQVIPPATTASPPPEGPLAGYQDRLFATAQRDISSTSVRAYSAGWNKFLGFCVILGIDPVDHGLQLSSVLECFLMYCVEDAHRKIIPDTANGYVSHVLKKLEHMGLQPDRDSARSVRYSAVLVALNRDFHARNPQRLRCRFPFTIPFILWSFVYVEKNFADPALVRALKAAFAAGHAFSLRPGEFLYSPVDYECDRYLCAATTFVWFNGVAYKASEVGIWPRGIPSHITSTLDVRKNSTSAGGPVAVARNSCKGSTFCCVSILCDYFRQAGLTDSDPLMMYQGKHMDTTRLSTVMKLCAVAHDIDPDRVVPACLRKNVITQMDLNTPQLQRQLQGGWRSSAGEDHYWTNLLQQADCAERAVHNAGNASINVIRAIFQTPTAEVIPRR